MKPALIVPFFNHSGAIEATLDGLAGSGVPCFLVDDGSDADCDAVLQRLGQRHASWLVLIRYPVNAGKGHAVMTGMQAAAEAGYSHGIQIDADGQHDASALPRMIEAMRSHPEAVIAGVPIYDDSVPRARLYGRYATHVWVWINTLSFDIKDSMCGFRAYPLAVALRVWREQGVGARMEFDTEIIVRLHWQGVAVVNLPVAVRYPLDGVSHFRLWRDNLRISWMHTRLFFGMLRRLPRLLWRRWVSAA